MKIKQREQLSFPFFQIQYEKITFDQYDTEVGFIANTHLLLAKGKAVIESLPVAYQPHVKQYACLQDQVNSALCYMLLTTLCGVNNCPISFENSGKPFCKDIPFQFSFGHTTNCAICVMSSNAVGIDIEPVRAFDERLAHYICTKEELQQLSNSHQRDIAFTMLWTAKESVIKCYGKTLQVLQRWDFFATQACDLFQFEIAPAVICSICLQQKGAA